MDALMISNTDRYAVLCWGNGVAYSMSNKRNCRSFFVQGDDAKTFRKTLLDAFDMHETEGSVYYNLTLDQVLAQVFDGYDHIAEEDVSYADHLDRMPSQTVH